MPTIELSFEQVVELVKRLPPRDKFVLLDTLRNERQAFWDKIHQDGEHRLRPLCAEKGRDWDALTEDERLAFVDDLLHED